MKDKNILIVTPFFFDYHKRIKNALEKRGAKVTLIDEQPSHSAFAKIMMRKDMKLYYNTIDKYFNEKLNTLDEKYDYILFIKCEAPTVKTLKAFKAKYNDAVFILYLWDSVKNVKGIKKKFSCFDKILSFDFADVKKYPFMQYAYWGYTDEFTEPSVEKQYDLAFVGTLHSIRPRILREIEAQCDSLGLKFYKFVFMPHILVYWYNKIFNPHFKGISKKDINFKSLSTMETIEVYKKSTAVLEIENIYQSGATTRFGEMVGMEKKIVTTFNCRGMELYRPDNQLILDIDNVKINKEFFETPYEKLPPQVKYKFSFDHFIDTVF